MDPNWIVAAATVVVAGAAIGSAIAAKRYADLTYQLILEQRQTRLDDQFPCIVVRSRLEERLTSPKTMESVWTPRLVNVGLGPAFIEHFNTWGVPEYEDGDHAQEIDKVIGPDVGNPDSPVAFGKGSPFDLGQPGVTIVIRYHDIAGRVFASGIKEGKPFYKPPGQAIVQPVQS